MRIIMAMLITAALSFGCSKESGFRELSAKRTDFFSDTADCVRKVQQYLAKYGDTEKVNSIVSVSYIDSKDKSYAFVFYQANSGEGNIVIQQDYEGELLVGAKSYKCDGEDCACKIRTLLEDNGTIQLSCNCTSCDMVIH